MGVGWSPPYPGFDGVHACVQAGKVLNSNCESKVCQSGTGACVRDHRH